MAMIKLNRINKGGGIVLNSEHILFVEVEGRSTTVHLTHNLLFSVEESPEDIIGLVEQTETARNRNPLPESGATTSPG